MTLRSRRARWFWTVLALLVTAFIWGNSLQTADQSSGHSLTVLAWVRPLLERTGLDPALFHTLVRKLAHMSEFAALAFCWALSLGRGPWALGLAGLTAAADETIQRFVPGRAGMVQDVFIDLAGAALGLLAAWICLRLLALFRRKRQ